MRIILLSFVAFMFSVSLFSQEKINKSSWSLYEETNGAYYFASEYKTLSATHFSGINKAFSAAKIITSINADYSYFFNDLTSFVFHSAFELSPVSIRPELSFSFTPVPFLKFCIGGTTGTGWNMFGFDGLSRFNWASGNYENLNAFKNWYYKYWAEATCMFDTGVFIPGDWSHVVLMYSYKSYYEAITGVADGDLWEWQTSKNHVNGLCYYMSAVIAYMMPLKVNLIGVMAGFDGHYNASDYAEIADSYDGDFMHVNISPLMNVKFSEKDSLTVLAYFESRRAFSEEHDETKEEVSLNCIGREWYFDCFAFSWTHNF